MGRTKIMENTMKYYKKENTVYAYDNEQLAQGYGKDMTPMTDEEVELHINPPKTAEQLEAEALELADKLRDEAMLTGEIYSLNGTDYKVSFTSEDGNGMLQVKAGFELGLPKTVIHFENGTKLPISASEFLPFALWFVTKRDSFFTPVEVVEEPIVEEVK